MNQTYRKAYNYIPLYHRSKCAARAPYYNLKYLEYSGVSEETFVGILLHVAQAAQHLQSLAHQIPAVLRAEHLSNARETIIIHYIYCSLYEGFVIHMTTYYYKHPGPNDSVHNNNGIRTYMYRFY